MQNFYNKLHNSHPVSKRNVSAPQNISNIGEYPNILSCAPSHTNRRQNRRRQKRTPHKMLSCKGFRIKVEVPSGFQGFCSNLFKFLRFLFPASRTKKFCIIKTTNPCKFRLNQSDCATACSLNYSRPPPFF